MANVTPFKEYQQVLDYLYSLVDFETRLETLSAAHYDLRRLEDLLERFGNPHRKIPSIHIAGTKGKGSTAAMISSVLTQAGYTTGLYISPHLVDLTERISINGTAISPVELMAIVNDMQPHITDINAVARYGRLTTFEVLTAIGFVYFHQHRLDLQVVEAGLGGRLDATNVLEPLVAVITTIGMDHMAVLGNTLSQIAAEKAGIIKAGSVVVCAAQPQEARAVIQEACRQKDACLIDTEKAMTLVPRGFLQGYQLFEVSGQMARYQVKLPLLGSYQVANLACAVAAIEELNSKGFRISPADVENGLARTFWPGRFQVMMERPLVIADGAHNPEAVKALLVSLVTFLSNTHNRPERSTLVFGASRDKNVPEMVKQLSGLFDQVIVTRSAHPRAMDVEKIATEFARYNKAVRVTYDVGQALAQALDITPSGGLILITGSLFVVGDALPCLKTGQAS